MAQPSIFLSHNYKDKSFARKLGDELRRAGANVWIDEAEIKLGDSLIRKVGEGIQHCDYLGVILSPDSVASEWVKREVELAMNQEIAGKRVVVLPLLYRECEIPIFLSDKLRADFTTREQFVSSLNMIKERLGLPLTPSSLPIDEQMEDLLYLVRSPLDQAQARLQRVQHHVESTASLHQQLAVVQFLVKHSALTLSRFRVLRAYSKGQYPVDPKPRQDVLNIVQEIVTYLTHGVDSDRNIRIVVDTSNSPKASLDQGLFEIAIANLLENALQYSYPDTTVKIACSQDADSVQVHFFNEGLTIDEFEQDSVFKPHFRGKLAARTTATGIGLGLYFAQQIMMSHGGTIKYRGGPTQNEHEFILDWPKQY